LDGKDSRPAERRERSLKKKSSSVTDSSKEKRTREKRENRPEHSSFPGDYNFQPRKMEKEGRIGKGKGNPPFPMRKKRACKPKIPSAPSKVRGKGDLMGMGGGPPPKANKKRKGQKEKPLRY